MAGWGLLLGLGFLNWVFVVGFLVEGVLGLCCEAIWAFWVGALCINI